MPSLCSSLAAGTDATPVKDPACISCRGALRAGTASGMTEHGPMSGEGLGFAFELRAIFAHHRTSAALGADCSTLRARGSAMLAML